MNIELLKNLIELAKSSKGVALDSRGIIIDPNTDKRFPKANSSVKALQTATERRGKFFSIFTNGPKEELRVPLEVVVANADFSKYGRDTSPWVVRQYPHVTKEGLDFRGVYAGTFAFFHDGVYHEINLVAPQTLPKAVELRRNAVGNSVLAQALSKYQTHYTGGYLVITLPASKGFTDEHAKAVETELRKVVDSSKMGDDFIVRRKGTRVYCEPATLVDGSETSKYNATRLGGILASEYTGKDYTVKDIIYVVDGIQDKSERDMMKIALLVFDVDEKLANTPIFQRGTPPIIYLRSSEEGRYYARCAMSTANGVGDFVYSKLVGSASADEGIINAINGLPLELALDAMASLTATGESLRNLPPQVIAARIDAHRIRHELGHAPVQ